MHSMRKLAVNGWWLVRNYEPKLPNAVACSRDELEACIAHSPVLVNHRRAARTTNPLERLFVEEHWQLKIIANSFSEKPVLKLILAP